MNAMHLFHIRKAEFDHSVLYVALLYMGKAVALKLVIKQPLSAIFKQQSIYET